MGLMSVLGKIGKAALNIGTGGIAGTIMDAAGGVGSVLGKQQQGAATGRQLQEQANQSRDRNAIDLYQARQGAEFTAGNQDLDRKQFENSNRGATAKQALIGALLSGQMDPTSISGGKASGGLLAALKANPEAIAAMKNLNHQAGTAQVSPLSFAGGQMVAPPQMSKPIEVDKGGFMSTLASVLQGVGAAGSAIPKKNVYNVDEFQGDGDWSNR